MARFSYITTKKQSSPLGGILPSIILFSLVIILFVMGTASLSEGSTKRQKDSLIDALSRDIVYCYATTGHYPESLESIRADYGLFYNEELFYVDYQVRAQNIIPDVTIIELQQEDNRPLYQKLMSSFQRFVEDIIATKTRLKFNIYKRAGKTLP